MDTPVEEEVGQSPGDLRDEGCQLGGLVGPGEGPAHVACRIAHVGTNAARAALLLVGQGLQDQRHHCNETHGRVSGAGKISKVSKVINSTC